MTWGRLKRMVKHVLHLGDSPQRTALAFSIGVFIAFSPTYGLHTISVFVVAWAFRLNVVAMLAGSLINNPWTVLPILASSMWVGLRLMPIVSAPIIHWNDFTFQLLWRQLQPYVLPFVLGSTLLGLIAALLVYPIVLYAILRYRKRQSPGQPVAPPFLSC